MPLSPKKLESLTPQQHTTIKLSQVLDDQGQPMPHSTIKSSKVQDLDLDENHAHLLNEGADDDFVESSEKMSRSIGNSIGQDMTVSVKNEKTYQRPVRSLKKWADSKTNLDTKNGMIEEKLNGTGPT